MKWGRKIGEPLKPDAHGWWYAWRPVKLINGQWAWLERVYRKKEGRFSEYYERRPWWLA